MSKKSRQKRALKRKGEKRARKAAKKAQYEMWARSGQNKKSKRFVLRSKRAVKINVKKHQVAMCGNVGCKKCFPELNANFPPQARFDRRNVRRAAMAD